MLNTKPFPKNTGTGIAVLIPLKTPFESKTPTISPAAATSAPSLSKTLAVNEALNSYKLEVARDQVAFPSASWPALYALASAQEG